MKVQLKTVILITQLLALKATQDHEEPQKSPRIAIIGGGIGGTAVAYFLKKAIPNAKLTIFEAEENVGGRLKTIEIAGKTYECGGTVIHPANQIMSQLVGEVGLQRRKPGQEFVEDFENFLAIGTFILTSIFGSRKGNLIISLSKLCKEKLVKLHAQTVPG